MMQVVGGTYLERCENPPVRVLRGSGLRAAIALRDVVDVELCSPVDSRYEQEASAIIGGLDLRAAWAARDEPVTFDYFTPLSTPAIGGRLAQFEGALEAEADTVLQFGLIETGHLGVSATRAVIDPQQPRDLQALDLTHITAGQVAVVANAGETRVLGDNDDLAAAARALLEESGVQVVVSKYGAIGALVTTEDGQQTVASYPTPRVWPLGSGDVFAAEFARQWGELSLEPAEAARRASRAAASYCQTGREDFSLADVDGRLNELASDKDAKVYLAGPFFDLGERWLVDLVRDNLRALGVDVFSPYHDIGFGGLEVAAADLEGLNGCDAILALVDGLDGGTIFEAGYATARELPIVAYGERRSTGGLKMLVGAGAELHHDLSTAIYRAAWRALGAPALEPQ